MKRRSFLKAGSLLSAPFFLQGVAVSSFSPSRFTQLFNDNDDKVLVLIQLNGGNDGLNTFIPLDQYEHLAALRSNILIPSNQITKIEDHLGLHPSFARMKELYDEEKLSIIQGVAYPDQNRSHFRSTDIWQTGSSANEFLSSGWLGRYLDSTYPGYPDNYPNDDTPDPIAISLGFQLSETCQGMGANYSIALNSEDSLQSIASNGMGTYPHACYNDQVTFLRQSINQLNAYSEVVNATFEQGYNAVEYADTNISQQLRLVAKLISGGSKTKIFVANIGGFDTHANQVDEGDTTTGEHAELLSLLSDAILTFQRDLEAQGNADRVIGMTYSEFGRRIRSNGSLGSDHGTGAPLIVFGNCASGNILGDNPDLNGEIDNQAGVPMQYDFRSVYASVLMDWLGADEGLLREILYSDFQYLPIITECSTTSTSEYEAITDNIVLYPNPVKDIITVDLNISNTPGTIEVYNSGGARIHSFNNIIGNEKYEFSVEDLPPGMYHCRMVLGNSAIIKKFIKL